MYISDLQRNKKTGSPGDRISLPFKRKVVKFYRSGLIASEEIERSLHISKTELRRMNRWYFKHRLSRYTYPSNFKRLRKKKTDLEYLKALEKRLQEAEKENKMLRLKAEAYEMVIEIAEEHEAAPLFPIRFSFCLPNGGHGCLLAEDRRLVVAENAGRERFVAGPGYGSGSAGKV